jgi:hypothetical protein
MLAETPIPFCNIYRGEVMGIGPKLENIMKDIFEVKIFCCTLISCIYIFKRTTSIV